MPEPPRTIRIVIADDHPIFRDGLKRLLECEADLQVIGQAADGMEAVMLVRRLKPDILLLDSSMPRHPGLTALKGLSDAGQDTRTILLTAAIDRSQIIEALQLGARGVVMKESATELLMKSIRCVMEGELWIGRESVADLVRYLKGDAGPGPDARRFGLTPRELEIVGTIVAGYTNRDIAKKLSVTEDTVKHHLSNIFDKLGVSNRLELALFAINHRLLEGAGSKP